MSGKSGNQKPEAPKGNQPQPKPQAQPQAQPKGQPAPKVEAPKKK